MRKVITPVTFGKHKRVIGYFIHRGADTWYWTLSIARPPGPTYEERFGSSRDR